MESEMKDKILFHIEEWELGGITVFELIKRIKQTLEYERSN